MYVDNGSPYNRVEVWVLNTSNFLATLSLVSGAPCRSIFIDRNDSLYCAMYTKHQVISRSLNSSDSVVRTMAGRACAGFMPDMLNSPYGIFVSASFALYVADSSNNRIQLFQPGQVNGTTIAGKGASGTITLITPTGVALDADDYVFIVDLGNNRIIGSGPGGFRCVVGCSNRAGSASTQLNGPRSMAFDTDGNIFVADTKNNRVQQFAISTTYCGEYHCTTSSEDSCII